MITVQEVRRGGRMKKATAPFHIDRKGHHLSLDAVPAWVCTQCGEPLFEEREVRTIQRLLTLSARCTRTQSLDDGHRALS
jgi:YgiT-type zinc finger domain-containing protein